MEKTAVIGDTLH